VSNGDKVAYLFGIYKTCASISMETKNRS